MLSSICARLVLLISRCFSSLRPRCGCQRPVCPLHALTWVSAPPGQFIQGVAILASDPADLASGLEVERGKCARLITGCIKLTDRETLTAESDLPPLSLRFKELAAVGNSHIIRLPQKTQPASFSARPRRRDSATGPVKLGGARRYHPSERANQHTRRRTKTQSSDLSHASAASRQMGV